MSYSMSPVGESRRPASAGVIQLGELLEAGVKCSMSIDHTTTYNCDCFVCMRMLYSLHQHRIGNRIKLTARRLVELATIDGARDLGIADKVGSLTPGKRADLILVRTTDMNMAPVGDPFEALVSLAQPAQHRHGRGRRPHPAPPRPLCRARSCAGGARSAAIGGRAAPARQLAVAPQSRYTLLRNVIQD